MEKLEIVKSITEYIEDKLTDEADEGLSLDEIAGKIGYSKFYLNRIFREQVGATIHQYIIQRRLTEAAKKIVTTDKTIIRIAEESGYRSHQAFTNAFSAIYLCTPADYRQSKHWTPIRQPYLSGRLYRVNAFCGNGVAA